jgi:glutathione S-transferase
MKLYYNPGTCSLSPHIVLREAGLAFDAVFVNTKTHTLADGSDYYAINPKGYVPMLVLDNGEHLTEGPAIVQYLADLAPNSGLAPAAGTMQRYRLMEALNFIGTELHKSFFPLFNAGMPEEGKQIYRDRLLKRFALVDATLAQQPYLLGDSFTAADAYLFTVTNWARPVKLDISAFQHLAAFMARVAQRPAVQAAMAAEGLIKAKA